MLTNVFLLIFIVIVKWLVDYEVWNKRMILLRESIEANTTRQDDDMKMSTYSRSDNRERERDNQISAPQQLN